MPGENSGDVFGKQLGQPITYKAEVTEGIVDAGVVSTMHGGFEDADGATQRAHQQPLVVRVS